MSDSKKLPILPLRDIVVFPHMIVPLFVGREKSVKALEKVMDTQDRQIILVTQKNPTEDDPDQESLYNIGTLCSILQLLKLPDGTVKVLVEGLSRIEIIKFTGEKKYLEAVCEQKPDIIEESSTHILDADDTPPTLDEMERAVVSQFENYIKLNRKIPSDVMVTVNQIDTPSKLADAIASYLQLNIFDKQVLLETLSVFDRLERILGFIEGEIGVMQVEKKIRSRVKTQMEKTQKEYYLNEQLKAIQKELGEDEEAKDEIKEFEERIKKVKLSQEAQTKAQAELRKLKSMNLMSAEATVVRNYLDTLLSLPWNSKSKIKTDLNQAQKVLDKDHYGLEKIKERILEYLAVQTRVGKVRGQILCLVGPPGVGKTSLGKSIAEATGRTFVRIALGGVRDESEIRGHRRTYIGSMPGKIIQSMRKAKTNNPLFLLDEIDKLGSDWRGDPSSALLEVLDPEQNTTFSDHYLEVDYDLSDVMFITTANTLNMPQPLLDRMEVIRLSGYTEDEKAEIAEKYLLPKQIELHGLKKSEFSINKEAIYELIRKYTRESGVRNLERELANLARKALKEILETEKPKSSDKNGKKSDKKGAAKSAKTAPKSIKITPENLAKYAGVARYKHTMAEKTDSVGVCTGLAWTQVGGELMSIESIAMPGKGKVLSTGKLGDVMQESVQAAMSFVRSQSIEYGIRPDLFEKRDIHVHVPEGAIPKDGPSAGIAICVSLVSALTGIPVRKDVAMTGEITLRGHALPIGGLKEKLLAALRGGLKTVLIPEENVKDLDDIPDNVKKGLKIIPMSFAQDALKVALTKKLTPIKWSAEDQKSLDAPKSL